MSKDINIHLKTTGADKTKQDLDQIAGGAQKVGEKAGQAGPVAEKGLSRFQSAIRGLVGAAGIAAVIKIVGSLSDRIAKFFDTISTKADEAVERIRGLRQGFDDLYEAMNAFDEKSRKEVTRQALELLQKTGTPKEVGIEVIDAYTRQFKALVDKGQISQGQYQEGLEGMLQYASVHGGKATPELVAIMAGWGMTTPEQQGEFRRQIASGAAAVGLKDADVIEALSKGSPTIKAMEWTPAYAVEAVATIAAGEAGSKRARLPGTTLQAIMSPQEAKLAEYGLEPRLAEQPEELLGLLQPVADAGKAKRLKAVQRKGRPPQYEDVEALTMLVDLYGPDAAAGVRKLLVAKNQELARTLQAAASEEGAKTEAAEWKAYATTQETRQAATEAKGDIISLQRKIDEEYAKDVRYIGEKRLERLETEEPKLTWFRRKILGVQAEEMKMVGAYRAWRESLTEDERRVIVEEYAGPGAYLGQAAQTQAAFVERWKGMSAQQRYEALTRMPVQEPPVTESPVTPGVGSPPTLEGVSPPESFTPWPPPQAQPEALGPRVSNNYDHRTYHIIQFFPVGGRNKQDLGIEPPYLG
ncbi:MAG: hypothetical protein JXN61_05300 [Sedimentisphaerales bacterium]|nr:hypothetical protein [Sedimentisphaerales bacterium]